jgi:pilus assembly protein Flp/PilA
MKEMLEYLKVRYLSDEKGQGIVEYALILAFIVVVAVAIGSGGDLRNKVGGAFNNVTNLFGN